MKLKFLIKLSRRAVTDSGLLDKRFLIILSKLLSNLFMFAILCGSASKTRKEEGFD